MLLVTLHVFICVWYDTKNEAWSLFFEKLMFLSTVDTEISSNHKHYIISSAFEYETYNFRVRHTETIFMPSTILDVYIFFQ